MTANASTGSVSRIWRESTARGWPDRFWVEEVIRTPSATWFARIAEDGDPDLPPLVLIHGLVVSGAYFRPVANELDDHLRLYVPDLPGFGRSTSRRGVWSLPELADGLAWWMQQRGLFRAVIMANSMGCQVATMLADRYPALVHALVLIAPTMDPAARSVVSLMVRGARDIPRERHSLWTVWLPDLWRAGVRRGLGTLRAGLDDPQDDRLGRIIQPAVGIAGEHDPIAPPAWVNTMTARMPCARTIVIPGAPHAMNYSSPRHLARIVRVVASMTDESWRRSVD